MRRELPPCFAFKAGQYHEQAWGSELTGPRFGSPFLPDELGGLGQVLHSSESPL